MQEANEPAGIVRKLRIMTDEVFVGNTVIRAKWIAFFVETPEKAAQHFAPIHFTMVSDKNVFGEPKSAILCMKYKDENPSLNSTFLVAREKAFVSCKECLELIHS